MTCLHLDGTRWNPALPTAVPALVTTVELTEPLRVIDAGDAVWVYLLVLARGQPVGWVTCPVTNGLCAPADMRRAITTSLSNSALSALVAERLRVPLAADSCTPEELFGTSQADAPPDVPSITVVVCTKDRPRDLERCLRSLRELDYPRFEVIVVDNGSFSPETRTLVESEFAQFRYVREERPGLNWARNRGLSLAPGELIAYTDDDAVVDRHWLSRLAAAFEESAADAVTGLIAPLELRTKAQLYFEVIGGFGRGCRKAWHRIDPSGAEPDVYHLGAGRFGAGANMAFRTDVLRDIGGFDPALDVGTPSEGGGDLEIFFRVLHHRHLLVYEPAAIVWHRHRDNLDALGSQINTWGTAMGAFLTAAFLRYPRFRSRVVRFGLWWSWLGYIGPAVRSLAGPGRAPRSLRFGPLRRLPIGMLRYRKASRNAQVLGASRVRPTETSVPTTGVAMRAIDLADVIEDLRDVAPFRATDVRVHLSGEFIGTLRIENRGHAIAAAELRHRVADDLLDRLLRVALTRESVIAHRNFEDLCHAQLGREITGERDEFVPELASIVVATRNRPGQLRRCLESLSKQIARFPYEIVVVDNAPESGATRVVVREFAHARYVAEPIRGLSSARNAGFRVAVGDILVATDDDVVAPPGWLQELVQPFRFAHVGITTGQVLPLALDHVAQVEFERMGDLSKGSSSFEVGLDWLAARRFQPPRVWDLGATANAAVRRAVLDDPAVLPLLESLGPGTPAGGGEDAYLFYQALAAGYGAYYEASAVVYHEHRGTMRGLRRQMFDYGRGHVAYLFTTAVRNGDLRALLRLATVLPAWHVWRLLAPNALRPAHRRDVVLAELCGLIVGPLCWIRALIRERFIRSSRRASQGATDEEPRDPFLPSAQYPATPPVEVTHETVP
jgi:glycosyltransferase involved in cell wall biosynthesis